MTESAGAIPPLALDTEETEEPYARYIHYPGGFGTAWTLRCVSLLEDPSTQIKVDFLDICTDGFVKYPTIPKGAPREFIEALSKIPNLQSSVHISVRGFNLGVRVRDDWREIIPQVNDLIRTIFGITDISYG